MDIKQIRAEQLKAGYQKAIKENNVSLSVHFKQSLYNENLQNLVNLDEKEGSNNGQS